MSSAGHIFDMIRRDKQNREMRKYRRERTNDARERNIKKGTLHTPDVSLEELEQINHETEEKRLLDQKYTYRYSFLALGIGSIVLAIIWIIFKG